MKLGSLEDKKIRGYEPKRSYKDKKRMKLGSYEDRKTRFAEDTFHCRHAKLKTRLWLETERHGIP